MSAENAQELGQLLRDTIIGADGFQDCEIAVGDETGVGMDPDQEIVSLRFDGQRYDLMIIPVEE